MAAPPGRFAGASGFCGDCGGVLPRAGGVLPPGGAVLPGRGGVLPPGGGVLPRAGGVLPPPRCPRCSRPLLPHDLEGPPVRTSVEFNRPRGGGAAGPEPPGSFDGPLVERRCPRCSHGSMGFRTRQTRAADEGQSVFYTCPRCRFQEKEDS